MRDYLDLFGLTETASAAELKSAYRRLVRQWHPDQFAQDHRRRAEAEARLKVITHAYRVLTFAFRYRSRESRPSAPVRQPTPIAPLEHEYVLTYLPLLVIMAAALRTSAVYALAGALIIAWTLMVWRVWHNRALSRLRRVTWILTMMLVAAVAVPIYFRRQREACAA